MTDHCLIVGVAQSGRAWGGVARDVSGGSLSSRRRFDSGHQQKLFASRLHPSGQADNSKESMTPRKDGGQHRSGIVGSRVAARWCLTPFDSGDDSKLDSRPARFDVG